MEHRDVVDDNDNVLCSVPKHDVFLKKLNHRIVHVLVFNKEGELFLQKRAATVKYLPGHWCTSAGGHVMAGETYEQAAERELREEINIKPKTKLREILYFTYEYGAMKKFIKVFKLVHDEKIDVNEDDVEEGRFFSKNELEKLVKSREFTNSEWKEVFRRALGIWDKIA